MLKLKEEEDRKKAETGAMIPMPTMVTEPAQIEEQKEELSLEEVKQDKKEKTHREKKTEHILSMIEEEQLDEDDIDY